MPTLKSEHRSWQRIAQYAQERSANRVEANSTLTDSGVLRAYAVILATLSSSCVKHSLSFDEVSKDFRRNYKNKRKNKSYGRSASLGEPVNTRNITTKTR